jgi:hypothetical protein
MNWLCVKGGFSPTQARSASSARRPVNRRRGQAIAKWSFIPTSFDQEE